MANPIIHQVLVDYESVLACCVMHASWPSMADPFYQHNPVPIDQRTLEYYNLSWVPDVMIDGAGAGYPGGPDPESYVSMAAFIDSCAAVPSPLLIACSGLIEDTANISIEVTVETPQAPGDYRLFVALIEDYVYLPSPSGDEHLYAFRWFNADNTAYGETIDLSSTGTQQFDYAFPFFENVYQFDQMSVTAWVQEYQTTEVLQAGKAPVSAPYFLSARYVGLNKKIGGATEPVTFAGELENRGAFNDVYDVTIENVPPGWTYSYTTPAGTFSGPSTLSLVSGELAPISLDLHSEGNPGSATVTFQVLSQASSGVTGVLDYTKMNGMQVLLLDDDNGANRETFVAPALDAAGVVWGAWDPIDGELTATDLADAAESVIWMCGIGNDPPTVTPDDRAALGAYLDGGGNLFLSGTDVAFDLADPTSANHTPESLAWFETYLHATYVGGFSFSLTIDGTPGDPIGDGLTGVVLATSGDNRQTTQDAIEPGPGADLVFTYVGPIAQGDAVIRWRGGATQVVFGSFGIEGIDVEATRYLVVERILEWFGATTGMPSPAGVAAAPIKPRSTPNPFRSSTSISYRLDQPGPVRLSIFDVHGRLVRILVDGYQNTAPYRIPWNGNDDAGRPVVSGVYFMRLDARGTATTTRLSLVR